MKVSDQMMPVPQNPALLPARNSSSSNSSIAAKVSAASAAMFTRLQVRLDCGITSGSGPLNGPFNPVRFWWAAAWLKPFESQWTQDGMWPITNYQTIYFANTRSRYWYGFAYMQECRSRWSGCRMARQWGGPTRVYIPADRTSYGMFRVDLGTGPIMPSYTIRLTC